MMGYSQSDIATYEVRLAISRVGHIYDNAIEVLRKQAEDDWYSFWGATKDEPDSESARKPDVSGDI